MIVFFSSAASAGDLFSGRADRHENIKRQEAVSKPPLKAFNPSKDMIALHYDHAPDKDDGQSAAADRTLLESIFGIDWIKTHVLPVSGAYGKNAGEFNPKSDAVMNAAWNDCGGWLSVHANRTLAITEITSRWRSVLMEGGDIWVKEGGQSDVTAAVLSAIKEQMPEVDTATRVHVVQHSDWNERHTTETALEYTQNNADYIRIRDANAYLNIKGGDEKFVKSAREHPVFGPVWEAAFTYYDPTVRLDFSDTGELLYILGLGEMSVDDFRKRFLNSKDTQKISAADHRAFPAAAWERATPESQGLDSAVLDVAIDFLENLPGADGSSELVVVRNGYVIWQGPNVHRRHGVWSITKSFVSALFGLLVDDQKLSLETLAADIDTDLKPLYPALRLKHFLAMTSGYRAKGDGSGEDYVHGPSATPFQPVDPLFTPPGSQYAYWDSAVNELGYLITKRAGTSMAALFQERIGSVIGLDPDNWSWGDFGRFDGLKINGGAGNHKNHISISAIDLARFGQLMLAGGHWKGAQLISAEWIDTATDIQVSADIPWAGIGPASLDGRGAYGYLWWRNGILADGKRKWPGATPGTFAASGYNNNKLFVIPEWNMVIVRLGLDGGTATTIEEAQWGRFLYLVGRAVS